MKSMIAMMNAMKVYKTNELIHNGEKIQEKLSQDISLPAYRKLMARVQSKYFLNRV